jgi:hypothetical protein
MRFLSNASMRSTWLTGAILGVIATGSGSAHGNPDLLDVVARIEYGYYAGDVNLLSAASAELERLRGSEPARVYYRAYAALRLNQIDLHATSRKKRQRVDDCLASTAELVVDPDWAVEAHVLAAACVIGASSARTARGFGSRGTWQRSIDAAREIDPDNPRLLLISALALPADDAIAQHDGRLAALAGALEQFDAQPMATGMRPVWGRADTLAHMGAIQLERGRAREARDLIERALLEAPGFHFALQLQKALSLH